MGVRFKIYMLFFPVSYLGLSALLPVFGTKLCAIAHRRHVQNFLLWIESMPVIAGHVLHKTGGGGKRYLTEKREGKNLFH